MDKHRVIFDCDPGVDDAISLLTAMASPEAIEILAITTVGGNVPLETVTRNACALRSFAGRRDVRVFAGCPRPLVKPPVFADHVHGEAGLGAGTLAPCDLPAETRHGVDVIIETLRGAPDASVTLVPTGPLTNIAVALVKEPNIARAVREIVLMGGAHREGGNITASAEFNMSVDPHAAHVVFESGCPIVAVGLDATYQMRMTPARMERLAAMGSAAGHFVHAMLEHVNAIYADLYGAQGCALHDPCTVGYLLAPRLFETLPCRIDVETASPLTAGHTAVDFHARTGRPENARWVTRLDADALFALILERLARL
ncbi:nucleoside hydrolase [Marinicauda algicola]|nr:nucleoside hydrolase [Marinicauda algicola]